MARKITFLTFSFLALSAGRAIEIVCPNGLRVHFTLAARHKSSTDSSLCARAGGTLCGKKLRSDYKNDASLKEPSCVRVPRSSENGHLAHICLLVPMGLRALTLVEAHTLQRFERRPVLAMKKKCSLCSGPPCDCA